MRKHLIPLSRSAIQQRGISLIVVTVLLLAIGLMATTAFFNSQTQLRLVSNIQFSEAAFSRAEATVYQAESYLYGLTNPALLSGFTTYSSSNTPHLYPIGSLTVLPENMIWSDSNSKVASAGGRYLIELLGTGILGPGDNVDSNGQPSKSCAKKDLFRIVVQAGSSVSTTGSTSTGGRMIEVIEGLPSSSC